MSRLVLPLASSLSRIRAARRHLPDWTPQASAAVLVAVLVGVLASVSIWQERQRRIERFQQVVNSSAQLLDVRITESLDKIDLTLQRLVEDLSRQDRPGAMEPRTPPPPTLGRQRRFESVVYRLLDMEGRLLYAPPDRPATAEPRHLSESVLADLREHLLGPHAAGADPGLLTRGPLPPLAAGDWHVLLARAAWLHDRTRRTPPRQVLVTAEVPVDELGRILIELDLGADSAKTLRSSRDLSLVYRDPWPDGDRRAIGGRTVSRQLREVLQQQPRVGQYVAATAIDGITRVNAYRHLDHFPFYVLVGMPVQPLPNSWRQPVAYTLLLALLTIGLSSLLLLRLYRNSQRRIGLAERRYEAIVQSSHDAIVSKTVDGIVTSWNLAAQQMFGYSAAEMIGQSITRLLPADRLDEEQEILRRIRRNEVVESFETVRQRKDGRLIEVSVTISPVLDGHGQIVGASKIARDISRRKAAEEEIRRLAYHDTLTGLPNRRLLLDRLLHAVAMSQRSQSHAALLFIDLDRFKQLNDSHGHEAGDLLLVEVAQRLRHAVRDSDTVARYGGDEFIVLCENLGPQPDGATEHARTMAEKISNALGAEFELGSVIHRGGASVGLHLFRGEGQDVDSLLRAADEAMYRVKSARRAAAHASHHGHAPKGAQRPAHDLDPPQ